MKNSKLGMVLSGGGTKGVAHAGVLKFLKEKNIEPEILACCSAGSIVGSLYSAGKSPEEIVDFFKSVYFFNWKHFTFNQPGLVSSGIFRMYLEPVFRKTTIGELGKDVRIVATELVSGKQKIFDKDFKVVDAIIASCSVPGVTTPYIIGNELYSDGGVLNNFPADIIKNECGKMIGVFVSPPQDVELKDLTTIKSVVSRSYDLLSYRTELHKFSYCDWFITSKKLSKFGMFERKAEVLDEIFQIGYQAAKESYDENFAKE
ncbi:MAG: patatin-like phospholipase family protein [Bergeyella sp.]